MVLGTSSQQLFYEMASRLQRPVWLKALRESGIEEGQAQAICDRIADHYVPWQEATFPGLLGNVIAGRIANRFDLHGTNCVTDAACASSLSALSMAINELALGQADMVITGGVDTMNDILMFMCFSKTPALSPTGDCRPFSDSADGTMLGEGLVLFALKRLADAEREGDQIYAVIRGLGSASDGRDTAIYAPLPEGQERALRRAYSSAGYGPDTVELVEAHGTGTKTGDVAELAALRSVFESAVFEAGGLPARQWCALGSVKAQLGHTKSAAGAVGLLKAALAVQHGILPPTIKVERPNPQLELETSPFYLNTAARPWVRDPAQPRRAGVSSFGFGGSNFHVTLEEYQPGPGSRARPVPRVRTTPTELILLDAESTDELANHCHRLASQEEPLAVVARQTQLEFRFDAPVRLAVVAAGHPDLASKLEQVAARIASRPSESFATPSGIHYAAGAPSPGQVAFVFSGQGSQYVGMGADIAMQFPQAQAVWDAAARFRFDDRALHEVVFPVPAFDDAERESQVARLTKTEWAQPALAVQSLALLAILRNLRVRPDCLGGHSFGELAALSAAGAFDADALVRLARRRGELMRDAAAEAGAMLAITATLPDVQDVLSRSGETDVWVANHNAPTQVVVSGRVEAIVGLERELATQGLNVRRLAVSTAFHTPLVAPAAESLLEFLGGIDLRAPQIDVYRSAEASPYPVSPDQIRRDLAVQVVTPVRFVEQIEAMYARGVRTFVEVGAGGVLTDLVGQILAGRQHLAVSCDRKGRNGVTSLHEALGRLAVAGVELDLAPLWAPFPAPRVERENKAGISAKIVGANYGRPYPPPEGATALPAPNPSRPEPVIPVPTAVPVDTGWLQAWQDMQQETAKAHAAYERAMADSHTAFLKMAEASFASLGGAVSGVDATALLPTPPVLPISEPAPTATTDSVTEAHPVPSVVAQPHEEPIPSPPEHTENTPYAPVEEVEAEVSLEALLVSIVAERTGYPVDMLGAHLELEADLGIDSIKRVEILSALRQRLPGLPELNPADLGKLRTIGQIVERLEGRLYSAGHPHPVGQDVREKRRTSHPPYLAGHPHPVGQDVREKRRTSHPPYLAGHPHPVGQDAQPAPIAPGPELVRLVVRAVAAAEPGHPLPGLDEAPLVVTDDGNGVAARVVERLARHGVPASVVAKVPDHARSVVFLGGLREVTSIEQAEEVNREAFRTARAVAAQLQAEGGVFVTVQDTGGSFGLEDIRPLGEWLGTAAALARTAAREWPLASVKAIDCECSGRDREAIAAALVRELLQGGSTLDVGLRADGTRLILEPVPAASIPQDTKPGQTRAIGPDSVVVASGGARGVTAATLVALARRYRPRLVLLGRTPLVDEPPALEGIVDERAVQQALIDRARRQGRSPTPIQIRTEVAAVLAGREVRSTLEALEQAGSHAHYLAVDIRDQPALIEAMAKVRQRWGPITGVVHGAGVLADRLIADQTDEQYDQVFGTKVDGLRALLAATANDPLRFLVLFSSVSAKVGNVGQSTYAMANSVLGQVASVQARRRPNCLVRAIAWGPWRGGMVRPELEEHFRGQGVSLIPLEAGGQAFLAELESSGSDARVIIGASGDSGSITVTAEHRALEVRIGRSHPYLADHSLGGVPVVPVALALEWMVRAVRRERRLGERLVLRDVRVLKGISLPDTDLRLQVHSRVDFVDGKRRLGLELRGEQGTRHYRALADLSPELGEPQLWMPPAELEPPCRSQLYDGYILFHGPCFQTIRELDGVSATAAAAVVSGVAGLGWPEEDWHTDPVAVDGGLQLALVWAERVLGGASLPMSVAEYRVWRSGAAPGPVRCLVRSREALGGQAVCDVGCFDDDGSLRAELLGVELVGRPDPSPTVA